METQKLTLEWMDGEDHVMLLLPTVLKFDAAPDENIGALLGRKVAHYCGTSDSFPFEIMQSDNHVGVIFSMMLYATLEVYAERLKTSAQYIVTRCVVELLGEILYDRCVEGDMGTA